MKIAFKTKFGLYEWPHRAS